MGLTRRGVADVKRFHNQAEGALKKIEVFFIQVLKVGKLFLRGRRVGFYFLPATWSRWESLRSLWDRGRPFVPPRPGWTSPRRCSRRGRRSWPGSVWGRPESGSRRPRSKTGRRRSRRNRGRPRWGSSRWPGVWGGARTCSGCGAPGNPREQQCRTRFVRSQMLYNYLDGGNQEGQGHPKTCRRHTIHPLF